MIAVHLEERDYHDTDYGKHMPVLLFKDQDEATIWLKKTGYVATNKSGVFKRVDYHSEVIAKLHGVRNVSEELISRPMPWSMVTAVDSLTHTRWVGFFNPEKDCLVTGLDDTTEVVVFWSNVESWEEVE